MLACESPAWQVVQALAANSWTALKPLRASSWQSTQVFATGDGRSGFEQAATIDRAARMRIVLRVRTD
jgi:hypothetical protein